MMYRDINNEFTKLPGKDKLLEAIHKHMRFVPGLSLGIIDGDNCYYYSKGQIAAGSEMIVRPDTGFSISSLSKVVTALVTMKLIDDGKLDLFSTVYEYLPNFMFRAHEKGNRVTLFNLLTHTSGLAAVFPNLYIANNKSLEEHVYQEITQVRTINDSNRVFNYSSANYNLLGYICECVTGLPFDQLVEQFVGRVGMNKTVFDVESKYRSTDFALGHIVTRRLFQPAPRIALIPSYHPSTQLISNVLDFMKLGNLLLNEGELSGQRLISQHLLQEMLKPKVPMYSERGDYFGIGLGFKGQNADRIVHEGIGLGYFSRIYLRPEKKVGVVWFANSQLYGHTSKITHLIVDEMQKHKTSVYVPQSTLVNNNNMIVQKFQFSDCYYSKTGPPSKIEIKREENCLSLEYTNLSTGESSLHKIRQKSPGYTVVMQNECKKVGFISKEGQNDIIDNIIIGNTLYSSKTQWTRTPYPEKYVGTYSGYFEMSEKTEKVTILLDDEKEPLLKWRERSYKLFALKGESESFSSELGCIEFFEAEKEVSGFYLNYSLKFLK